MGRRIKGIVGRISKRIKGGLDTTDATIKGVKLPALGVPAMTGVLPPAMAGVNAAGDNIKDQLLDVYQKNAAAALIEANAKKKLSEIEDIRQRYAELKNVRQFWHVPMQVAAVMSAPTLIALGKYIALALVILFVLFLIGGGILTGLGVTSARSASKWFKWPDWLNIDYRMHLALNQLNPYAIQVPTVPRQAEINGRCDGVNKREVFGTPNRCQYTTAPAAVKFPAANSRLNDVYVPYKLSKDQMTFVPNCQAGYYKAPDGKQTRAIGVLSSDQSNEMTCIINKQQK